MANLALEPARGHARRAWRRATSTIRPTSPSPSARTSASSRWTPTTGEVKILRYIAVDDVGVVINPMIVDGQVHGGVAQGIGQALYEHAIYDDSGNLVTGSMLDYTVPNATQIPVHRDGAHGDALPAQPHGRQGRRRDGHHRVDPGGGQRRRGCALAAGHSPYRHAADAGACLARDPDGARLGRSNGQRWASSAAREG